MSQANSSPTEADQRFRLPRFRDKKKHLIASKADDEVPYDPPLPTTVRVWDAGPLLISNESNRRSVNLTVPGEGRMMRTSREDSSVCKNKTVRINHPSPRKDDTLRRKSILQVKCDNLNGEETSRSDDEKITSVEFTDLSEKRRPIKRQMSPPADRFVPLPPDTLNCDSNGRFSCVSDIRVDSPGRFVNLLSLSHRRVAMLDKSTQCDLQEELNDLNRRDTSAGNYLSSPARSRLNKTHAVKFSADVEDDSTRSPSLHHRVDTPHRSSKSEVIVVTPYNDRVSSPVSSRNITHETIEETISISNASSDEFMDSFHPRPVANTSNNVPSTFHNASGFSNSSNFSNASNVGGKDATGRDLFDSPRVTHSVRPATSSLGSQIADDSSLLFKKPVNEDYRKSMAVPPPPPPPPKSSVKGNSATLGRRHALLPRDEAKSNHNATGETVHAFTLDRKYLDRRKKSMSTFGVNHCVTGGVSSEPFGGPPGFRKAPSLPEKDSTLGIRRFASTRDVSGYQSEAEGSVRRGGLAAAFKERQARASLLNNSIERNHHASSLSLAPNVTDRDHLREFRPRTRSFLNSHQIQAEVHYVPIKTADGGAPLNRHQSILQRKHDAKLASERKEQRFVPGVVTFAPHGKQFSVHPSGDADQVEKKKKDVKRTQSIPKDTKFPWLAKFRMKTKARQP